MLPYVLWTTLITLFITIVLMRLRERVNLPGSYILTGSIICFAFTVLFPVGLRYMRPLTAVLTILAAALLAVLVAPRFIEKGRLETPESNTHVPDQPASGGSVLGTSASAWSLAAARLRRDESQTDLPDVDADGVEVEPVIDSSIDSAVISVSYIAKPVDLTGAADEVRPDPAPDTPEIPPITDSAAEGIQPEAGFERFNRLEPALDEVAATVDTGLDPPAAVIEPPAAAVEGAVLETLVVEVPPEAVVESADDMVAADEQPEAAAPVIEESLTDSRYEAEPALAAADYTPEDKVELDEHVESPPLAVEEPAADAVPVEAAAEEPSAGLAEEPLEATAPAAGDLVIEEEHSEGPIVVPLLAVGEDSADARPVEEPMVAADVLEDGGALAEHSPAIDETSAAIIPELETLVERMPDLEDELEAADETDGITEPEPLIEVVPETAEVPAELIKTADLVDSNLEDELPTAPASGFVSGLVLPSEPDNYLGREFMAIERLDAVTAPPMEPRTLSDLINEGFDAKEQGRWEDTVRLFKQALETNRHPDLSVLLVLEVTCQYRDHGLYQQAIDFINGFLSLHSVLLDVNGLSTIRNELYYIESVYGLLKQSGTPDLPSSKIPRLIRIKAEELFLQKKV
ncbi:MAG: hypothetical protein HPY50_00230 [Firmicutes bacterium]|nr:hypothetical protein [Bacillota bacterium]